MALLQGKVIPNYFLYSNSSCLYNSRHHSIVYYFLIINTHSKCADTELTIGRTTDSPKKVWKQQDSNLGPLTHELTILTTRQPQWPCTFNILTAINEQPNNSIIVAPEQETSTSQCYKRFTGLYLQFCKYRATFNITRSHNNCQTQNFERKQNELGNTFSY